MTIMKILIKLNKKKSLSRKKNLSLRWRPRTNFNLGNQICQRKAMFQTTRKKRLFLL